MSGLVRGTPFRVALLVAALAALLTACTVTVTPEGTFIRARIGINVTLNDVITEFAPTRGEGASYGIGQSISFRLHSRQSGYVTLSALDPDGAFYTFARNVYVRAGENIIRGPSANLRFFTTGPYGRHYVRAAFTSSPSRQVVVSSRRGVDAWNRSLETQVRDADVRDVVQTYYWVD